MDFGINERKPLVSVCIPVYNRPELIKKALDSCLAQTYKNIEIVVVDDASTDNTYEVIKSYVERDSRVKAYRNEKNLGMVPNWLRTFELAMGEYVQHLGSDDWLDENFIEKKIEIFLKYPDAAFVGGRIRTYSKNQEGKLIVLNETGFPAGRYETKYLLDNFYKKPAIISLVCMLRRVDMLENFIVTLPNKWGYDDFYLKGGKIMDDFVFLKILILYNYMYYIDDAFYNSLDHSENSTKSFFGLKRGKIADHIKFSHIDVVGFSYFYKNYAPRHLSKFRIFFGANTLAGAFLDLALGRAHGSPWRALRNFFSEYSQREKILSYLKSPAYLIRRIYEWILRKMNPLPIVRIK